MILNAKIGIVPFEKAPLHYTLLPRQSEVRQNPTPGSDRANPVCGGSELWIDHHLLSKSPSACFITCPPTSATEGANALPFGPPPTQLSAEPHSWLRPSHTRQHRLPRLSPLAVSLA